MVTGTDLVEWQLRVASGGKIPLKQDRIPLEGHAIEARICAEDPAEGFRPGAGLILEFGLLEPIDGKTLRWDAGFETGDRVPSSYDSMIAKLIVFAGNRDAAVERLTDALAHTQLAGVPSNTGFLRRCVMAEAFHQGAHHVDWIAAQGEALTHPPAAHQHASVMAVCDIRLDNGGDASPWGLTDGFRLNASPVQKVVVAVGADADWHDPSDHGTEPQVPLPLVADLSPRRYAVTTGGDTVLVEVPDYDADVEAVLGGDTVSAPMPGKLLAVAVKPGDTVSKGDAVAVMEAMKMEHTLIAPRDGVVEAVGVSAGEQVAEGDILVHLEAE